MRLGCGHGETERGQANNHESGRSNRNLDRASANKNDEFYTRFEEIEKEAIYYKPRFKGSVVFCKCYDCKEVENLKKRKHFWNYFYKNFEYLELKKLIATHYLPPEAKKRTYKLGRCCMRSIRFALTLLKHCTNRHNFDFGFAFCYHASRAIRIVE